MTVINEEWMLLYPLCSAIILEKSLIVINKGIHLTIPNRNVATIDSTVSSSPCELLVCPGIFEPTYTKELTHLVKNLTNSPLANDPKQPIVYLHLLNVESIIR